MEPTDTLKELAANYQKDIAEKLPSGILNDDGVINFDNLLQLYKMTYEFLMEAQTAAFFDLLAARHHMHVRKNKD